MRQSLNQPPGMTRDVDSQTVAAAAVTADSYDVGATVVNGVLVQVMLLAFELNW